MMLQLGYDNYLKAVADNMVELKVEFESLQLLPVTMFTEDKRVTNKVVCYHTYGAYKQDKASGKLDELRTANLIIVHDQVRQMLANLGDDTNYIPQKQCIKQLWKNFFKKPSVIRMYTTDTVSVKEVSIIRQALMNGIKVEVIKLDGAERTRTVLEPVAKGVHPLAKRIDIPRIDMKTWYPIITKLDPSVIIATKLSIQLIVKLRHEVHLLQNRYRNLLYPLVDLRLHRIKDLIWKPEKTADYIPETVSYIEERQRGARAMRVMDEFVRPDCAMYARAFQLDITSVVDDQQINDLLTTIEFYKNAVESGEMPLPEGYAFDIDTRLLTRVDLVELVLVDFQREEALTDM